MSHLSYNIMAHHNPKVVEHNFLLDVCSVIHNLHLNVLDRLLAVKPYDYFQIKTFCLSDVGSVLE
jgi:hypothetical protein